ncbi:MAG TPA: UvrD-helicase domain-containing protein, partial [Anaerolineae bacterium]|nr:UvrD-helicase domain-containing protein [Anaerolineae bacterium]
MNRPSYLPSHLTDQQLEAILLRGSPLLIIAGPGSGKTEVITWRVAHLVASGQADSAHCLVTTFTNKAALELKDRIQRNLRQVGC